VRYFAFTACGPLVPLDGDTPVVTAALGAAMDGSGGAPGAGAGAGSTAAGQGRARAGSGGAGASRTASVGDTGMGSATGAVQPAPKAVRVPGAVSVAETGQL
jgi:hypothetical protein